MTNSTRKPQIVVVHDDSVVGRSTLELMQSRGLSVRQTRWADLDLEEALGFITIPPTHGESVRLAASRARVVLDAALEQDARLVQVHHPGVLGRESGDGMRGADDRALPEEELYFQREYVREMEIYRFLEAGAHIVPVAIGFAIDSEGASDWKLRETIAEWGEFLSFEGQIDTVRAESVAAGLVAALQQARPGRRYVFGGKSRPSNELAEDFGLSASGPFAVSDLGRGVDWLARVTGIRAEGLQRGLEPFLFGTALDSTRARGELGYMPRAPILKSAN